MARPAQDVRKKGTTHAPHHATATCVKKHERLFDLRAVGAATKNLRRRAYLHTFVFLCQVPERQSCHEAEHRVVVRVGGQHGANRSLIYGEIYQRRQSRTRGLQEV